MATDRHTAARLDAIEDRLAELEDFLQVDAHATDVEPVEVDERMPRAELEAIARTLGITDAKLVPNKAALVEQIEACQ